QQDVATAVQVVEVRPRLVLPLLHRRESEDVVLADGRLIGTRLRGTRFVYGILGRSSLRLGATRRRARRRASEDIAGLEDRRVADDKACPGSAVGHGRGVTAGDTERRQAAAPARAAPVAVHPGRALGLEAGSGVVGVAVAHGVVS